MKLRFHGTRGSLPVALTASEVLRKVGAALHAAGGLRFEDPEAAMAWANQHLPFATRGTFGGHTSCVELVTGGEEYVVCDAGSGLRPLGQRVLAERGPGRPATWHLFQSHPHWDHIMGFPFFAPAYIPGNHIRIYGGHADLAAAFRLQQSAPGFPVDFERLGARIEFVHVPPGTVVEAAGLRCTSMLQMHGGDSYGWRFDGPEGSVVYSTDSEHRPEDGAQMAACAEFFRAADVVVFDAMYSLADAVSVKEDWGHSSNIVGVELCHLAGARHLVLFHHEPIFDDARLADVEAQTRRFEVLARDVRPPLRVTMAFDGLELEVG